MNRKLETYIEGESHVKISHFTRQGFDIAGIVHVGTNDWYEYDFYLKMGIKNIIGFEPLRAATNRFLKRFPEGQLFGIALGNEDVSETLNVAGGDGQSSTFYQLTEEYKKEFPNIQFFAQSPAKIFKFTTWIRNHPDIDLNKFDCLVVDVEGMELEVLRGFGEMLQFFKFLNVECSGAPTYIGAPSAEKIIKFLDDKGFRQETPIEPHNDIMFVRKDVKKE